MGRFTGRQLTTMICVGIAGLVAIPTVAFATGGSFTSTVNTVPGVTGTNSSAQAAAAGVLGNATGTGNNARFGVYGKALGTAGIGVQGGGAKFGVFSNGPLGVAAGKTLSCAACVTTGDYAAGSIHAGALGTGAVGSGNIVPGSITSSLLAPQSVDSSKLATDAQANAYTFQYGLGTELPIANASLTNLVSLNLPAGDYVVTVNVQLLNGSLANAIGVCELSLGTNTDGNNTSQALDDLAPHTAMSEALTLAGHLASASTARLDCENNTTDPNSAITTDLFVINAIRVASVTHQ